MYDTAYSTILYLLVPYIHLNIPLMHGYGTY